MKITLVKKILKDGSPCKKCIDVMDRLTESGNLARIDEIVDADERDPESMGIALAREYQVNRAPFFVVEREGKETEVYTVFMKFQKEVLEAEVSDRDTLKELAENQDLDFL